MPIIVTWCCVSFRRAAQVRAELAPAFWHFQIGPPTSTDHAGDAFAKDEHFSRTPSWSRPFQLKRKFEMAREARSQSRAKFSDNTRTIRHDVPMASPGM